MLTYSGKSKNAYEIVKADRKEKFKEYSLKNK